jgi:hypothetical protein
MRAIIPITTCAIGLALAASLAGERNSASYEFSYESLTATLDRASSDSYELTSSIVSIGEETGSLDYRLLAGSPLIIPGELSPPFLSAAIFNSGNIQFQITGPVGHRIALEFTTDLKNWTRLQTNTLQTATIPYGSPALGAQGYFRAVLID